MDSCSPRPTLPANDPDAARLVCLAIAIALHLAAFWWLYAHQPAPITPPLPLTLSARWVGEAATNDAPAKAAVQRLWQVAQWPRVQRLLD